MLYSENLVYDQYALRNNNLKILVTGNLKSTKTIYAKHYRDVLPKSLLRILKRQYCNVMSVASLTVHSLNFKISS